MKMPSLKIRKKIDKLTKDLKQSFPKIIWRIKIDETEFIRNLNFHKIKLSQKKIKLILNCASLAIITKEERKYL